MCRGRTLAHQTASPRMWLTLAALLAFFLQSLVIQTHIHGPGDTPTIAKASSSYKSQAPAPAKSQDLNDQCRLCQELVHAGVFIAPSVAILHASQTYVFTILAVPAPAALSLAAGFAWYGRAPPRR